MGRRPVAHHAISRVLSSNGLTTSGTLVQYETKQNTILYMILVLTTRQNATRPGLFKTRPPKHQEDSDLLASIDAIQLAVTTTYTMLHTD